MGQFFNQPDFGTVAKAILPTDIIAAGTNLKGACLYVGEAGDVTAIMTSKFGPNGEYPIILDTVLFKNVPAGSILPVIVDFVVANGTTASRIVALK
jgi:hypothetical protein